MKIMRMERKRHKNTMFGFGQKRRPYTNKIAMSALTVSSAMVKP